MIRALRASTVLTVAYCDQFEFPLTTREIFLRLIWTRSEKIDKQVFVTTLINLIRENKLQYQDNYVFLPGRSALVDIRKSRSKNAKLQRQELKPLISFLKKIPWIKGVVLTGSLAMSAIRKKDDSDFLIVVEPGRLWISRILITLYAMIKGKRRSWRYEEENSWCFNLWLDSDHLGIPSEQRSVYLAYEICQADWLWWRGRTALEYILKNAWARKYLPHYWDEKLRAISRKSKFDSRNEHTLFAWLPIDFLAYRLQLWYMKPHRTRERVSRGFAFFHPRDTGSLIKNNWQKSINDWI